METANDHETPTWSTGLSAREIRRLVDIVVAAEQQGRPSPALTTITPGMTVAEARRIRNARLTRLLGAGRQLRAVAVEPVSSLRLYTDDMIRSSPAVTEVHADTSRLVRPVLTVTVPGTVGGERRQQVGVAIEVLRPMASSRPAGPDLVACNGAADLLVVPGDGTADGYVDADSAAFQPARPRWTVNGAAQIVVAVSDLAAVTELADNLRTQLHRELVDTLGPEAAARSLTLVLGLLAEPVAVAAGDTVEVTEPVAGGTDPGRRALSLTLTDDGSAPDPHLKDGR